MTNSVNVISGDINLSLDAGVYIPAKIKGFVWDDLNANGIQDANEPGLEGAFLSLYTDIGDYVGIAMTDESGNFMLDGIIPGAYYGAIQPPSSDYFISPMDQGSSEYSNSDFDPDTNLNGISILRSGDISIGHFDAGLYLLASVGDFVFLDLNANGIQDTDEAGFPFPVGINIYDEDSQLLSTITSNETGFYIFEDLVPGSYELEFMLEEGDIHSPQFKGDNDELDSNVNPNTKKAQVTLTSGEINNSIDAGIIAEAPYYPDWVSNIIDGHISIVADDHC